MSERKGGILFGVIMGAVLGVLFAPKKGKDIRKQLQAEVEKGGLGTETLKQNFTEMGHEMANTAQTIYQKPEVQKQVRKGQKSVDNFVKMVKTEALEKGLHLMKSHLGHASNKSAKNSKSTKSTHKKTKTDHQE